MLLCGVTIRGFEGLVDVGFAFVFSLCLVAFCSSAGIISGCSFVAAVAATISLLLDLKFVLILYDIVSWTRNMNSWIIWFGCLGNSVAALGLDRDFTLVLFLRDLAARIAGPIGP